MDHINRDEYLVLEQEDLLNEIDHETLVRWNWSLGDTDSEIMWIEYPPTHALLYLIYMNTNNFLRSASARTVLSEEHATMQSTMYMDSRLFLIRLEMSIVEWNHASRGQIAEYQQEMLTEFIDQQYVVADIDRGDSDTQLNSTPSSPSIEASRSLQIGWRTLGHVSLTADYPDNQLACPICYTAFETGHIFAELIC